jgi:hypothetical protein
MRPTSCQVCPWALARSTARRSDSSATRARSRAEATAASPLLDAVKVSLTRCRRAALRQVASQYCLVRPFPFLNGNLRPHR